MTFFIFSLGPLQLTSSKNINMNFISIILIVVIYLIKIFIKNYKSLILQQRYHRITTELVAFKINIKNSDYLNIQDSHTTIILIP